MARYINADKAIDKIHALRIKYMTDHKDIDNPFNIFWECCDSILQTPTADVQAFFTEDEIALINEYKDEVKAIDFKTAILNAVSVALDKVYWQNVFANKPTDSAPTADVREVIGADGYDHLICPHCLSEFFAKTKAEMFCPDCGKKFFFSEKWGDYPYVGENIERGNGLP